MTTLFVSDLHLDQERPEVTRLFLDFLDKDASQAEALYMLGDIFEVWIGDDDHSEPGIAVAKALKKLSDSGVPVFLMHGNRDFLIGKEFVDACGATLLAEQVVINLYGTPTLLLHGDELCVDDHPYQAFRQQVRNKHWIRTTLAKPLAERRDLARHMRDLSLKANQGKSESIMDVCVHAVDQAMRHNEVKQIIHGHTHRPAIHDSELEEVPARRIVLGDWHEQGSVLRCDAEGCKLEKLAL